MLVKTDVLYGKSEISVNVPDDSTIIEPQNIDAIEDYKTAIKDVLRHPTNSKPLKEMVKSDDIVSIVISDITRPTPNHILVPLLIEELNHVPRENFVIINGTGTHRDQTRDELIQMLGEDIVDTVKIVHNHCTEADSLIKVGRVNMVVMHISIKTMLSQISKSSLVSLNLISLQDFQAVQKVLCQVSLD